MIVNYDRNCSFIVLATVITIVNYDHHLFIVQATAHFMTTSVTKQKIVVTISVEKAKFSTSTHSAVRES